jgi:hypothetical protein
VLLRLLIRCAGVVAALGVVTGCSGGSASHGGGSASATDATSVRTATCASWKVASADERTRLVVGLREFFGGQVDSPGARGQVLPDARARKLFDAYCAQRYAAAFNLYRLYGNAAAFTNPQK